MPPPGGDPGLGMGFDWSSDQHDFKTPATIYVCLGAPTRAVVRLQPSNTGVHVTSAEQSPGDLLPSVLAFAVEVDPGATGSLVVQMLDDDGKLGIQFGGPYIVTEADGWHFSHVRPPGYTDK